MRGSPPRSLPAAESAHLSPTSGHPTLHVAVTVMHHSCTPFSLVVRPSLFVVFLTRVLPQPLFHLCSLSRHQCAAVPSATAREKTPHAVREGARLLVNFHLPVLRVCRISILPQVLVRIPLRLNRLIELSDDENRLHCFTHRVACPHVCFQTLYSKHQAAHASLSKGHFCPTISYFPKLPQFHQTSPPLIPFDMPRSEFLFRYVRVVLIRECA